MNFHKQEKKSTNIKLSQMPWEPSKCSSSWRFGSLGPGAAPLLDIATGLPHTQGDQTSRSAWHWGHSQNTGLSVQKPRRWASCSLCQHLFLFTLPNSTEFHWVFTSPTYNSWVVPCWPQSLVQRRACDLIRFNQGESEASGIQYWDSSALSSTGPCGIRTWCLRQRQPYCYPDAEAPRGKNREINRNCVVDDLKAQSTLNLPYLSLSPYL